jgi:SnoaL-like polyketide cyclase
MFKIFPDNHVANDPYKVLFGQGEWTCSIAIFTGTHLGPMKGAEGKTIPPTNKKFQVEFCTVAHWTNRQIVEENLFYDQIGMMRQLGLA